MNNVAKLMGGTKSGSQYTIIENSDELKIVPYRLSFAGIIYILLFFTIPSIISAYFVYKKTASLSKSILILAFMFIAVVIFIFITLFKSRKEQNNSPFMVLEKSRNIISFSSYHTTNR